MDLLPNISNFKVIVRNLPGTMDENEFRILSQKFSTQIKYFKYIKPMRYFLIRKGEKSQCFLQLSSGSVLQEFLKEFSIPFFDSKGEQFLPSTELSFCQEVSNSPPNKTDLYTTQAFLEFREKYEAGEFLYDESRPQLEVFNKKSELILALQLEAEEEKKQEEIAKIKSKKWRTKTKSKKWTKK